MSERQHTPSNDIYTGYILEVEEGEDRGKQFPLVKIATDVGSARSRNIGLWLKHRPDLRFTLLWDDSSQQHALLPSERIFHRNLDKTTHTVDGTPLREDEGPRPLRSGQVIQCDQYKLRYFHQSDQSWRPAPNGTMEHIQELRQLLGHPSHANWAELIELFSDVEVDELVQDYTRDHLEGWPDGYRQAQPWMLMPKQEQRRDPARSFIWSLVRSVTPVDWNESWLETLTAGNASHLRELYLVHPELRNSIIEALLSPANQMKLHTLGIVTSGLTSYQLEELLHWRGVEALAHLSIADPFLLNERLDAGLSGAQLPALRSFSLSCCHLDAEGMEKLYQHQSMRHLRSLSLHDNIEMVWTLAEQQATTHPFVSRELLEGLFQEPMFEELASLTLSSWSRHEGFFEGLDGPKRSKLTELSISCASFHDEDLFWLMESQIFPQLRSLSIHSSQLSEEALENIIRHLEQSQLEELTLASHMPFSKELLQALGRSPSLRQLRRLRLPALSRIKFLEDFEGLLQSPHLSDEIKEHFGKRQEEQKEAAALAKMEEQEWHPDRSGGFPFFLPGE